MKDILISGASIAGPTLAYWLHRHGFRPTVVERAPSVREGGYAVDVRGPARDVLARMGLEEAARAANTDTRSTSFLDPRGRVTATVHGGFGVLDPDDLEIMRGDLARILYEATRADVPYLFDDSVTALEEQREGVLVRFARQPARHFDLVIGADGVRSNIRRLAFGDEAPFVRPLGMAMAIFTAPNFLGLDREQLMYMSPGKVVSVKSDRGNRDVKVCLFFAAPSDPVAADLHRNADAAKALITEVFAVAGWQFPALLRAMEASPDFYFDLTSQVRMERWSRGRVSLVGDACGCPSPLTGQGTSLALVGAHELARALAETAGDHTTAFSRYEARMRPFIRGNQDQASRVAASFAPRTRRQLWWRNASLKLLTHLPFSDRVMKLAMRDMRTAAHAYALPPHSCPRLT